MAFRTARLGLATAAVASLLTIAALLPRGPSDRPAIPLPLDVDMSFDIVKYASIREYIGTLHDLEAVGAGLCAVHTGPRTYGGDYPIDWITVGDPSRPALVIVSVLHAKEEWQGAHLVLTFIRHLATAADPQHTVNARILERFCVVAVPMVNVWGYFASPHGKHHNGHSAPVTGIERATWHDMSRYGRYSGVNLNRNFDWRWTTYPSLPWSARRYWNGHDYGAANYFMMPFYLDSAGREVYDPANTHSGHVLGPDPEMYDYKGPEPFSEPETRLVRDLFATYDVAGFIDLHVMMPTHRRNTTSISRHEDAGAALHLVNDGLARVVRRHAGQIDALPASLRIVTEEYDGGAPCSLNWVQNVMGVASFGWETGTGMPQAVWTDAYMEMLYRAVYWLQDARPSGR